MALILTGRGVCKEPRSKCPGLTITCSPLTSFTSGFRNLQIRNGSTQHKFGVCFLETIELNRKLQQKVFIKKYQKIEEFRRDFD